MNRARSQTECRAGHLSEIRGVDIRHWICEMRSVGQVVHLGAELKLCRLHNREVLKQREIVVLEVRPAEHVPSQVPELPARCRLEVCAVEELRTRTTLQRSVERDEVCRAEAVACQLIRGHRERSAGRPAEDAVELPVAENLADDA